MSKPAVVLPDDAYTGTKPVEERHKLDEAKLDEEANKPQTYRWPGARLRDGSVSDY